MSLQVVLMIGDDPGWSSSLMARLSNESLVECLHLPQLAPECDDALRMMDAVLPDLILIFADSLEEQGADVNRFCRRLRERALQEITESKPVVVVHSNAPDEAKRIQYMLDGADDTFSGSMSPEELRVRLLVQLRRNIDMQSNSITLLPGLELAGKTLQRRINLQKVYPQEQWALMAIEMVGFDVYNDVYGYLAGNQVLRAVGMMLNSLIVAPDLVAHSSETDTFLIVSTPDRIEKLAKLIIRQFEDTAPTFYSDTDKKRGYLMRIDDHRASRRVPLMHLAMGIAKGMAGSIPYETHKAALTAAMDLKAMARHNAKSHWVSDTLKLTGSSNTHFRIPTAIPEIVVIESDEAMAYLLKTTLEMQHYNVTTAHTVEQAWQVIRQKQPTLVLMDALINEVEVGWQLCTDIKHHAPNTHIVFLSSIHDREKALSAGADLYLPKPFEMLSLFSSVDSLLVTG